MKRNTIKIGNKYNKLTVMGFEGHHIEPSGHKRQLVKVRCDCGSENIIKAYQLKRGNSTQCRKCGYEDIKIVHKGDTFDKLTVIGFDKDKQERNIAVCKCLCGNIYKIRPESLKINKTNHCGCDRRGGWKGMGNISGTFFYRIKRNAKIRNIPFNITKEEIWDLYQKQKEKCALSGLPIHFSYETIGKNTASLDRIDNSKGYEIPNVQWVHVDVNKMKMNLDQDKFLELCKLIYLNTAPVNKYIWDTKLTSYKWSYIPK